MIHLKERPEETVSALRKRNKTTFLVRYIRPFSSLSAFPTHSPFLRIEESSTDCSIHLFLSRRGLLGTLLSGAGSLCLSLDLCGLGTIILAHGGDDARLFLGLDDSNGIRERLGRTSLALGVGAAHDLDLDTKNTLS